jgi:signal transduction histidine kinase
MRDVSIEREQEQRRAEFVSTASHEMRTPVAAIEGYLALAMNPKISIIDDKAKSYIVKARASTKRLGELFQDLLTASKSEDGRLVSHPIVINTDQFLSKIIEEEKFGAQEKNLDILMTHGGKAKIAVAPVYLIHVDENRMAEVVTNLINNAIKFTEKGRRDRRPQW